MRGKILGVVALSIAIVSVGCTPRVRIRKSPGPKDTGLRYYRPKPYLRIEPAGQVVTEGRTSTTTPSDEFVSISLDYLPDFTEEYSIDVRPGLGTANVSVELENGWNLTSLNQDVDSQFDENVEAFAELAKAASGFIPTRSGEGGPSGSSQRFVVEATNVPIGYYESVISKDSCGRKRLYGWRYIGFLPFSPCPTEVCGSQHVACNSFPTELFGLVFEKGVMKFKRLDSIDVDHNSKKVPVSTGSFITSPSTRQKLDALETAIREAILINEGAESKADASLADDSLTVELKIQILGPIDEDVTRDRLIRSLISFEDVELALEELGDPLPTFEILAGAPLDVL